jgi:glycine hydroxymethyltransferase
MHIIAAKAVALKEALDPSFIEYQNQIVKNAAALATALKNEGFNMVSDGTDNHLILIDLQNFGVTGKDLEKMLDAVHITVNKNAIPNDPQSPFITSGIRIGTPAVTSRGFKEAEMAKIASWIKAVVVDFEGNKDRVSNEVQELCNQFPIYQDCN